VELTSEDTAREWMKMQIDKDMQRADEKRGDTFFDDMSQFLD
jgi:hypothetical protein